MEKYKPCIIHWVDISIPDQYWANEDEAVLEKCVSRGYFIKQTENEVVIAQTISEKSDDVSARPFGGLLTIPIGAVVKIETDI